MNRNKLAVAMLAALGASSAARAEGEMTADKIFAKENFTANVAMTTDYRFRGISNSDGVAVQGGMDWAYNGLFLGGWASNTEFSDANVEVDVYGGYSWAWSGVDFTLQGIYYMFPGESPTRSEGLDPPGYDPRFASPEDGNNGFPDPATLPGLISSPTDVQPYLGQLPDIDANYFEVNIGVAKTFSETYLAPSIGFDYNYSPDYFGEDGNGHAFQISTGLTLPMGLSPYFNFGYQDVEGDEFSAYFATPDGYDWWWLTAGVSYDVLGFTLDVAYHWVDRGDECGGVEDPVCRWNGGMATFYNDYNYSPDYFGEDGNGHAFQISTGLTLPMGLSPYFNAGYQDVEGDEFSAYFSTPDGYDWWWLTAGVSYDVLGFTLDVAYHWVDRGDDCDFSDAQPCRWNGGMGTFYNDYKYSSEGNTSYRDLTNDEVVFTISRSF